MAFRPTITVVINKKIADIGYYRNWPVEDLFIEALGIAVLYRDCRTVEELRDRMFGAQDINYIIEPEEVANTQDNLRWLEDCSEMPIQVDLSRQAIYEGHSDSSNAYLHGKKDVSDLIVPRTVTEKFYWDVLTKCKICLDKVDMDSVTQLFMSDEELVDHLSKKTAEQMRKMIMKGKGGADDETGAHRLSC